MPADSKLDVTAHGVVLSTEQFDACVEFYHLTLGLPVWFTKENLVCLRFGGGYLMLQKVGYNAGGRKSVAQNPTKLRFHVKEVDVASKVLEAQGLSVDYQEFYWGTIATFHDPDGNVCELKNASDPFFL